MFWSKIFLRVWDFGLLLNIGQVAEIKNKYKSRSVTVVARFQVKEKKVWSNNNKKRTTLQNAWTYV